MGSAYLKLDTPLPAGIDYPLLGEFVPPDLPYAGNLSGLYVMGRSEAMSIRNFANPGLPLIAVGTPAYEEDGVLTSRTNYFNTRILPSSAMTFVFVFAAGPTTYASQSVLLSNYTVGGESGSGIARGDTIQVGTTGGVKRAAMYRDRAAEGPLITNMALTPELGAQSLGVSINATTEARCAVGQLGSVATTASGSAGARGTWARPYLLGGGQQSVATGISSQPVKIRMVAIYNGIAMSEAQLEEVASSIRQGFGPSVGLDDL